jgi:hypothetical protein
MRVCSRVSGKPGRVHEARGWSSTCPCWVWVMWAVLSPLVLLDLGRVLETGKNENCCQNEHSPSYHDATGWKSPSHLSRVRE